MLSMLSQSSTIQLGRAARAADLAADRDTNKSPGPYVGAFSLRRLAQIRGWKCMAQKVL